MHPHETDRKLLPTTVAALGIVYGDIGTSPLYAFRECFHGAGRLDVTTANVHGVLSLIFWSLILVVSVKYLVFVMRADNDGEGGILALMKLAVPKSESRGRSSLLIILGLFGAGLLYGDGVITPAISVLSAVEGIHVATSSLDHLVLPITLTVLLALFLMQRHGTAKVGRVFGPVMLVWFAVIALMGLAAIVKSPQVLAAVSPHHAVGFFAANGFAGFAILGVVFLVVTGGEALYADMGHFGRRPIRIAWFAIVLPSLLLNYFGQGALLLSDASASRNPFYLMSPTWALVPLVILSTIATVIASQAVISGAFSLTSQAIHLGYLPAVEIIHTSKVERGQIYVPVVNWLLFVCVVGLVLAFRTSSNLAAAYGMAVTTTMVITAVLFYVVARQRWHWSRPAAFAWLALFLTIDVAFFAANLPKFFDGGWFPISVGVGILIVMTTWHSGRRAVADRIREKLCTTDELLAEMHADRPTVIPKPAIYLTSGVGQVPLALLHNLRHNGVIHHPVGLLTIVTEDIPWVPLDGRLTTERVTDNFYRIVAHYGFKQRPSVPNIIEQCRQHDMDFAGPGTTYFLNRFTLDESTRPTILSWRGLLFRWMSRNAGDKTRYYQIPPKQVVEIGTRLTV